MKLTPVMEQYHRIKSRYPDKILFFRMGDFYEMFGDDAVEASKILNIALTSRSHGNAPGKVPLAGVPYHAVEKYINVLLQAGKKVVLCDQVEDSRFSKGLVKREVVEIVTPGTVIASEDSSSSRHLIALHQTGEIIGMAVVEFTSGTFNVEEGNASQIKERIEVLSPVEIVVNSEPSTGNPLKSLELKSDCISLTEPHRFGFEHAEKILCESFKVHSLDGFGIEEMEAGIIAAGAALSYLQETKQDKIKHLNPPSRSLKSGEMFLDSSTIRNLELLQTSIPGRGRSLLATIDFTLTPMGKRLLTNYLSHPLYDISSIQIRQRLALAFLNDEPLSTQASEYLKKLPDIEKLTAKLGSNRLTPRDLGTLLSASIECQKMKYLASDGGLKELFNDIPDQDDLIGLLKPALNDELPAIDSNGGIFRTGYSEKLDGLKESISESKKWIAGLQNIERARTGIPNLKVGYNQVFGYYIEISSSHLNRTPDNYIRKQTLVGGERFVTEELKTRESEVLNAEEKINDLEKELFAELIEKLILFIPNLKKTSQIVSQIDVLRSFAALASSYSYIMPQLDDSKIIEISESRHPVIERTLPGRRFVPNDLRLGSDYGFLHIITGPNMAGKSTYLRQIGQIVILAQIGCFVPAAQAKIGLVDRVFTRVGASDLLPEGKSTFLVEMNEVANILNNATYRSLVLLDEVGRGTSTYDGLSIAWAVSEFIHEKENLKCRTLFATHYHELTDLASRLPGIRNFQVAVKEWEDEIIFLHRIIPGGCDDSYGIQVARLAGIPAEVISRAHQVLQQLEQGDLFSAKMMLDKPPKWMKKYAVSQMTLFGPDKDNFLQKLKNLDITTITPLEALRVLSELMESLKHK
ncbi:MAG: DNA mismatch repair protein MutS [candidate division Zixibacteria bacterium CG_4_9_14_3_um_filter_46_8]|nr:MAG: DNA mismatch repair protein MutS [candidate division Zixibacteria bacterium CG_4_9_14_3_um_filter_46_8]